jgi:integrating conjugative element protein (TIGR03756 family)
MYPWIRVTPYASHYIPDLVVSVFPQIGKNAFDEANTMIDQPLEVIGQAQMEQISGVRGGFGTSGSGKRDMLNHFFEVDVVGNPAATVFSGMAGIGTLPAATTPYVPYYSSLLDMYLWHSATLEITLHPQALVPFMDNEGSALAPWGSLYPRYGKVTQTSRYKAAAMVALRSTHLATRQNQSHVYTTAPKICGEVCNVVRDPTINDNDSVKFQMVYPEVNTTFDPDDFGKDDSMDFGLQPYGQDMTIKGDNAYVWLAWRKYEGCVPAAGKLINVVKTG